MVPDSSTSLQQAAKTSPGDVFRHLLAIITLYVSAFSFGTAVFVFIDRWFPDPLAILSGADDRLRWALSALVIVFPVYIWVSRANARAAEDEPVLFALRSRRWLYYFTVFAASVVIIGDLIALIYNFLSGELTGRFILKVAAILFIAVSVFTYYLWNIRRQSRAASDPRMRIFILGIIAIIGASIIYGFFLAGSPFAERMRRFDERRVNDLQSIQWQIINYWQKKGRLPDSSDQLRDDISGFVLPLDPETGMAYDYRPLSGLQFELCALFAVDSHGVKAPLNVNRGITSIQRKEPEGWTHGSGRVCFTRTIDPVLYGISKPML